MKSDYHERMMKINVRGPIFGVASLCEPILIALPEWFGIEESTRQYIRDIETLPTFLVYKGSKVTGFLTVKLHNHYAAEIHVMGVLPESHHQGAGQALLSSCEAYLMQEGVEYLQVKTLSPSDSDVNYARTRAFYSAMGFRPLEEFPTLWGEENPCLQMIKKL